MEKETRYEFFVPREGIDYSIICRDLNRYLDLDSGIDVWVRPGIYKDGSTSGAPGFCVSIYRNISRSILELVRADWRRLNELAILHSGDDGCPCSHLPCSHLRRLDWVDEDFLDENICSYLGSGALAKNEIDGYKDTNRMLEGDLLADWRTRAMIRLRQEIRSIRKAEKRNKEQGAGSTGRQEEKGPLLQPREAESPSHESERMSAQGSLRHSEQEDDDTPNDSGRSVRSRPGANSITPPLSPSPPADAPVARMRETEPQSLGSVSPMDSGGEQSMPAWLRPDARSQSPACVCPGSLMTPNPPEPPESPEPWEPLPQDVLTAAPAATPMPDQTLSEWDPDDDETFFLPWRTDQRKGNGNPYIIPWDLDVEFVSRPWGRKATTGNEPSPHLLSFPEDSYMSDVSDRNHGDPPGSPDNIAHSWPSYVSGLDESGSSAVLGLFHLAPSADDAKPHYGPQRQQQSQNVAEMLSQWSDWSSNHSPPPSRPESPIPWPDEAGDKLDPRAQTPQPGWTLGSPDQKPTPKLLDIAQFTDSGYASAAHKNDNGFAPAQLYSLVDPASGSRSDVLTGDADAEDQATVYSVAWSVPEDELDTYKSELAETILNSIGGSDVKPEILQTLAAALPSLLKAFALRLGSPGSSKAEREIMYFIHKHRGDIAARFREAAAATAEGDSPTRSVVRLDEEVVNWQIGQWLERVGPDAKGAHEHNMDAIAPKKQPEDSVLSLPLGYSEDRDMTDMTEMTNMADMTNIVDMADMADMANIANMAGIPDTVEPDDMDEQPSLPDKRGYRDAVFTSAAYNWLMLSVQRTLQVASVGPSDICSQLREKILASLLGNLSVSSRRSSASYTMRFIVDWDPTAFLREEFPGRSDLGRLLGDVITLTGSLTDAQALPCAEYLRQTWPATGIQLLDMTRDALLSGKEESGELSDKSVVKCSFKMTNFHVQVDGTADSIAEIGEQIGWIGAALRQSSRSSGLVTCHPTVSAHAISQGPNAIATCAIWFTTEGTEGADDIDRSHQQRGRCWHELFRNPVVVQGYPIPRRASYNTGLEIPLNMMSGLTRCPRINTFHGRHYLKGFHTALVPTEKLEDSVLWHLFYSKDDNRLPYPDSDALKSVDIDINHLTKARHLVGWCSEARFYAGAPGMNYEIRASQLKKAGRDLSIEKVTTSFSLGELVSGGATFGLGRKDTHVRITRGSYKAKLQWLDQKYMTLWDVDDQRGWLVNGSGVLLHLLRTSLESSKVDKFRSEFLFDEAKFEESPRPHTLGAALDVLLNPVNQRLELYPKDEQTYTETKILPSGQRETIIRTVTTRTTIKDRIEELYETLEKLIDHNAQSDASQKGPSAKPRLHEQLEGWDFADVATDRDPFYLKKAELPMRMLSWVDLARAIPAITLFGRGFGDVIRASSPSLTSSSSSSLSSCAEWETVPKHKHLLCLAVADLRDIIDRVGDQYTCPITLAPGMAWSNTRADDVQFHQDCPCRQTQDGKGKKRERHTAAHHAIQEVSSWKTRLNPATESQPLQLRRHHGGAVIFGNKSERWWPSWGSSPSSSSASASAAAASSSATDGFDTASSSVGTTAGASSGPLDDAYSDTQPTSIVSSSGAGSGRREGGSAAMLSPNYQASGRTRSRSRSRSPHPGPRFGRLGSSPGGSLAASPSSAAHTATTAQNLPPPPSPVAGVKRRSQCGDDDDDDNREGGANEGDGREGEAAEGGGRRRKRMMPIRNLAEAVEKTFRRGGS